MTNEYNREKLFTEIAKIVAHPHTHLTSHDNSRALAIMVVIDDYLGNFMESDNNGGHYIYEQDGIDFLDFVKCKLGIDDYSQLTPEDVLK